MEQKQSGRQDSPRDLGTSSDRAIYSPSEERGRGDSSERNRERDDQPPFGDDQQTDQQQRRDDSQHEYDGGMPDGTPKVDR